jgi:cellulose biosynthesis protein BcsQ
MLTITFSCLKGGDGKTLLAVLLSRIFAHFGLRVLVIDMDPQHHISGHFLREKSNLNVAIGLMNIDLVSQIIKNVIHNIDLIQSSWGLIQLRSMGRNALSEAMGSIDKTLYDVCIVDTAGTYDNIVETSLLAADLVIHPIAIDNLNSLEATVIRNSAIRGSIPEILPRQHFIFNRYEKTKLVEENIKVYQGLNFPFLKTHIPFSKAQARDSMDRQTFIENPSDYHLLYPAIVNLAKEVLEVTNSIVLMEKLDHYSQTTEEKNG